MSSLPLVTVPPTFVAYVLAFGVAAVVCFVSVPRARTVTDADTRRGLVALLLTSGGWASAHVAFLVVPTSTLKLVAYHAGLVVGFSTVGAWLYFCSAYTGRTLHRAPAIRRLAVGTFLGIVAVKLSNPLHGLYFDVEFVTTPFAHLAVQNGLLHWVVMGLAYALALVGYFMLFELFWQVGHETKPLVGLVALTALPGVFDLVGFASPLLVNITYEPLGVAAFAVGVLYLYLDVFESVRLTGGYDGPVVVVDGDTRVRDYNGPAKELFGELTTGEPFDPTVPDVSDSLDDETVVEIDRDDGPRYYQVSTKPLTSGRAQLGRVITFTDVTEREQYRQELESENERLERFASMVSHDLRNPLNVAMARINILREETDDEHLEEASVALERMEALIEDVLTLARQGETVDDLERVSLSDVVEECWSVVATADATVTVDGDLTFEADPDQLRRLLENLFRNAIDHGGDAVAIRVGELPDRSGFYVADDGPGIPEADRETVFESGHSTDEGGSGFGLAIVEEVVEAHGWTVTATESADGGARFEIAGVASS